MQNVAHVAMTLRRFSNRHTGEPLQDDFLRWDGGRLMESCVSQ
jgi:hypothetical protein